MSGYHVPKFMVELMLFQHCMQRCVCIRGSLPHTVKSTDVSREEQCRAFYTSDDLERKSEGIVGVCVYIYEEPKV